MLICRNAEGVHGKKKVGNPCTRPAFIFPLFPLFPLFLNKTILTAVLCHTDAAALVKSKNKNKVKYRHCSVQHDTSKFISTLNKIL